MEVPSPPVPAPAVRERILAAAVQLMQEKGLGALTQTRVSEIAGVRQSHLTYYFPTRSELLQQAVFSACGSVLSILDSTAEQRGRSIMQFRRALEAQFAERRVARIFASFVVASEEDPSLKVWIERFQADMLNRLQKALLALGLNPPRMEMEVFRATVVGALHMDLAVSTEASFRRAIGIYRFAFRRLIRASRSSRAGMSHRRRPMTE